MNSKITICIPTYGKKVRNQYIVTRLLNSLTSFKKSNFRVIMFNTTEPLDEQLNCELNKLIDRFKDSFQIMQVNALDLEYLRGFLVDKNLEYVMPNIKFKGFSNMRNAMLIVANILKSKIVLMLDDDTIIEDKNFLTRAKEYMGLRHNKKKVFGKSGYYIYDKTGYKLTQQSKKTRKLWLKETYLNEALRKLIYSKTRLNESNMAFGGIMVLHSNLYKKIPFDPHINRGEDTDYAINAKQFEQSIMFDNKLKIRHCPEKKLIPYWMKLRQDIYRFIYEKEKLKYFNKIEIKSLEPYPAAFLKDDIEYKAVVTSINYAGRALKMNRHDLFKEYFNNARIVFNEARIKAIVNAPKYFELQKNWAKFMFELPKYEKIMVHFNRF